MFKLFIKIMFAGILTSLLFFCVSIYRTDLKISIKVDDMAYYNNDNVYPLLDKFIYNSNEDITIPFIIVSNSEIISLEYESIGFSILTRELIF